MVWVSYEGASDQNHLVLGQFGFAAGQQGNFEAELRDSMSKSGRERREDLDVEESDTYKAKINAEDAEFRIVRGKGRRSEKEFWEAVGQFRGHGGPAMLILRVEADQFSKDQVLDVIKSMEK
jgi:hypothetical protein